MTNLLYPIPWMKYLNASVSFAGCKHTEMLIYSVARLNIFQKFSQTAAGRFNNFTLDQWAELIPDSHLLYVYLFKHLVDEHTFFFLQNVLKRGILMHFPSLLEHLHFSCYHIWISSFYIQWCFWTPLILCFSIIWSVLDVFSTFAMDFMICCC